MIIIHSCLQWNSWFVPGDYPPMRPSGSHNHPHECRYYTREWVCIFRRTTPHLSAANPLFSELTPTPTPHHPIFRRKPCTKLRLPHHNFRRHPYGRNNYYATTIDLGTAVYNYRVTNMTLVSCRTCGELIDPRLSGALAHRCKVAVIVIERGPGRPRKQAPEAAEAILRLQRIREQTRLRVAKARARKKGLPPLA